MRINVTLSIDSEIKDKAMDIIQNKLNSSMSREIEAFLKNIIEDLGKEINKEKEHDGRTEQI